VRGGGRGIICSSVHLRNCGSVNSQGSPISYPVKNAQVLSLLPLDPMNASRSSGPMTKQWFLREIIPALRTISAPAIAEAVGLSVPYRAKVRAGRGIPSRKHWAAFVRVVQQQANPTLAHPRS
jgi:hypothetical protein